MLLMVFLLVLVELLMVFFLVLVWQVMLVGLMVLVRLMLCLLAVKASGNKVDTAPQHGLDVRVPE